MQAAWLLRAAAPAVRSSKAHLGILRQPGGPFGRRGPEAQAATGSVAQQPIFGVCGFY